MEMSGTVPDPPVGNPARTSSKEWWPADLRRSLTKPNGTVESYRYLADGMMAEKVRDPVQGANETQVYAYDRNANRIRDERGTYTYDARDHLREWDRAAGIPFGQSGNGDLVTYTIRGDGQIRKKFDQGAQTTTLYDYDDGADEPSGPVTGPPDGEQGERLDRVKVTDNTKTNATTTSEYSYTGFGSVHQIVATSSQGGPPTTITRIPRALTELQTAKNDADLAIYVQDLQRVLDLRARLPQIPFRNTDGTVMVAEYSSVLGASFGQVIECLAVAHDDDNVTVLVADPSARYYKEQYGYYPGFRLHGRIGKDDYWRGIGFEPGCDPTGAISYSADALAIVGSSMSWSLWAERRWEMALLHTQVIGGAWLEQDVPFRRAQEAVDTFTVPRTHRALRDEDVAALLRALS